jgi:hypothetical protein
LKASEYVEKYGQRLWDALNLPDEEAEAYMNAVIRSILEEFLADTKYVVHIRHAVSDSAIKSILREQCDKWNAVTRLLNAKYGMSILKEGGLKSFFQRKIPEFNY